MPESNLDKLVMLLSTDWFLEYWPAIGLATDEQKRTRLQAGCREIVGQIMGGEKEYWLISFARSRTQRTDAMLHSSLNECGVEKSTITRVDALIADKTASGLDSETSWLLTSITEMLVHNSLGAQANALEPDIRNAVSAAWTRLHSGALDFESLSLESESAWDQYIRGLTPDLPTYLSDYVSAVVRQNEFEALWGFIKMSLRPNQKSELLRWYGSVAESLTGERRALPANLLA